MVSEFAFLVFNFCTATAWKAEGGVWKAVEDSCPHRMAPLSLGFINNDRQLVCRYHGWEFNGDGKATCIPMSTDANAEATAVGRRKLIHSLIAPAFK
jgi:phenylpropionate dioxygenase-like ring-hydroxylating dioxygenase large terminal subunit